VEKLWARHSEKIRLYLAKADEAGSETDRQKVLMQIVQELCKRPGLNRSGFEMPTIYLPDVMSKPTRCANQIDEVCVEIQKVIEQTIQNSLNNLEADCEVLNTKLQTMLNTDTENRALNWKHTIRSWCLGGLGVLLPVILFVSLVVANSSVAAMREHIGPATDILRLIMGPVASIWIWTPPTYHLQIVTAIIFVSGALLICSRLFPSKKVLPSRELKSLKTASDVITKVANRKREMYTEYLKQSVTDADFND
jgi:hypothetical protein